MNFVKRAMAAVAVSAFVMAPQASSQELTHGVGTSPAQTHVAGLEMVESGGWGVDAHLFESTVIRPNESGEVIIELPEKCKPRAPQLGDADQVLVSCQGKTVPLVPIVMSLNGDQVPFDLRVEKNEVVIAVEASEDATLISAAMGDQAHIVANETKNAAEEMNESTTLEPGGASDGFLINSMEATTASVSVVNVPSGYRYCPTSCTPTSLHDYCTWSPDAWGKANFRGPCAIHDMDIDRIRVKAISLTSKRSERYAADRRFGDNMRTNCRYYYPRTYLDAVNREACLGVTLTYEGVVRAKTTLWDGR